MKTITTLILCFALVTATAEPPKKDGALLAGVVLGCLVVGIWVVFYAYHSQGPSNQPMDLVLEESPDGLPERAGGKWTPICTNYGVVLDGRKLIDVFPPAQRGDENRFYRVHILN